MTTGPGTASAVLHVRCAPLLTGEGYREVLELLREFSPVVQPLPPRAALVQVRGAQRYFGTDARRIAEVVRLRAVARLGTDLRIGVAGTWAVAAMASARVPGPGGVLDVPAGRVAEFLGPLPVESLYGLGPRQAEALHHGIKSSELVTFENSSHMQFVEEPERYVQVVGDFLGRVEQG